jgi:broad specificity phosphatase PhoE
MGWVSTILFVRHGESEANILRVISNRGSVHGLTERGRRQVEALAAELKGAGVTRIYSSPLLRAVQTGEILAEALDLVCEFTDALREFDCGIAEGRSDPEAWELHRDIMERWLLHRQHDARIPEGESFGEIRSRFVRFVGGLLEAQEPADSSILVGHGGLYECMLPLVLVNLERGPELPFPNAAYVLAEKRCDGLFCQEWCGKPLPCLGYPAQRQ